MKMIKRDFSEIVEALRFDLAFRKGFRNTKFITNKDIAEELGIKFTVFNTKKSRGSIPYEKILDYCYRHKVDAISIFYKKDFKKS